MKKHINIFIHRRDFRIIDNMALDALVAKFPDIPTMHVFIFNPTQIDPKKNVFFNKNCVEFMIQSLKDLRTQLRDALYFFHGKDTDVLTAIMNTYYVNCIAWNSDYTPFARNRDEYLVNWCNRKKIEVVVAEDYSLFKMGTILSSGQKPYQIFTPFYRSCIKHEDLLLPPAGITKHAVLEGAKVVGILKNIDQFIESPNLMLKVKGGREEALKVLARVRARHFKNYDYARDYPAMDKTTKLAAYIKFGCVSVREVFDAFKKTYGIGHGLVRELIWREFYAHATWHFPHVLSGKAFKDTGMRWQWKQEWYDKVMVGKTGFPIIDAAIRELLATGWMNNRLRMVVASFITKDLAMDWTVFERDLFGRHLVDYDPSTNCHSWQGIASVGIDAAPYWRVMNPWRQMERFDKDCVYVKKWLPELKGLAPQKIKNWRIESPLHNYPNPMVDHDQQVQRYLALWKSQG
jgi:deoxyribodipyrimidine photo-lyase